MKAGGGKGKSMSRPIVVMWLLKISKNMSEELKVCSENRGIIICVILPDNNSKHSKLYSTLIYFSSNSHKRFKLKASYSRVKLFVVFSGGTASFYSNG